MFLSTEIFSKRQKSYAWLKRNQSCNLHSEASLVNKACGLRKWCVEEYS